VFITVVPNTKLRGEEDTKWRTRVCGTLSSCNKYTVQTEVLQKLQKLYSDLPGGPNANRN
jgi:hypothetical protein